MLRSFYQENYYNRDFPFNAAISFKGDSFQWHWHEEFEILVCLNDSFIVGIEDIFYPLEENELIIIPGNQMHCVISPPNSRHLTMKFSPKLLNNSFIDFTNLTSRSLISSFWNRNDKEIILKIIKKIWHEHDNKKRGYQSAICQYLYQIQTYGIRHFPLSDFKDVSSDSHNKEQPISRIHSILLYISKHYKENITLTECAKNFNFNPNYFSSYFTHSTGINFHKYLQILRLREFEHLLTTSDESITEICSKSGFSSVKTLNRIFRDAWDMSPSEYRIKFKSKYIE